MPEEKQNSMARDLLNNTDQRLHANTQISLGALTQTALTSHHLLWTRVALCRTEAAYQAFGSLMKGCLRASLGVMRLSGSRAIIRSNRSAN